MVLDDSSLYETALNMSSTHGTAPPPDMIAHDESQKTSCSVMLLPADSSAQGETQSIDVAADPYEMQETPFFTAPAPADPYETTPSVSCVPPDSFDSSEQQVASPGAEVATAETLLSLHHEEHSTRPRPPRETTLSQRHL